MASDSNISPLGSGEGVQIASALDESKISFAQYGVFILCFLAMLVDSFDAQILPYVGPALTADLRIEPVLLGGLISAGFMGTIAGGLFGGMLADRVGRRVVILSGLLVFGLGTLSKGLAHDYSTLLSLQIVTGLGLGGVFVNVLALTAEYSPARSRRFIVTCITMANGVGGILAGYATVLLTPDYGWRAVFIFAGIVTIAILLLCLIGLPHSLTQLTLMGRRRDYVSRMMARIAPDYGTNTVWTTAEPQVSKLPLADIFRDNRAMLTIILCVASLSNFLAIYFVTSWTPTLMSVSGLDLQQSVTASMLIPIGAIFGSLLWGRLADLAWPPLVLGLVAALSVACYLIVGYTTHEYQLLAIVLFISGMSTGILSAFNGLVSSVYPTSIRGTALGFVLGVGRAGSIVGSMAGGALLGMGWSAPELYRVPAAAAGVTILCMVLLTILPWPRRLIAQKAP